jgi:hypothetical protein
MKPTGNSYKSVLFYFTGSHTHTHKIEAHQIHTQQTDYLKEETIGIALVYGIFGSPADPPHMI